MQLFFNSDNFFVFDDYQAEVKSGDVLGLPQVSWGWEERTVFVANAEPKSTVKVSALFNEAVQTAGISMALTLALLYLN